MNKTNEPQKFKKAFESITGMADGVNLFMDALKGWQGDLKNILAEVQVAFEKLPESFRTLSDHGWYVFGDMTPGEINGYSELLVNGKSNSVDLSLMEYFDQEAPDLLRRMIEKFPERRNVLEASMEAHILKSFYLSTPVFFAQADGVFNEMYGVKYFSQSARKQFRSKIPDSYINSIRDIELEPLKHIGINRKPTGADDTPSGENRHDVLHGKSYDYGENPVNSYKALSFLLFVGVELPRLVQLK